ncbi:MULTISPECIES: Bax inhibitor-1/YccA family protein [Clavibacter]|uniref:Bax inhibitor-1/YccA family protein n=2 Tax=Clavibacter TaxID=1573 RepID=A0A399NST7_9MICO|nr:MULTISPECIES: Bax inhibitor-1/YccA family protein [Clavibacter]KDP91714.1 membrane protein [Clavibacter cf. michiganensis LMG 26808]RII97175.1 Bax inhibitor-1/YccA family protein [Clavibacter michiganensis]UKF24676.1 Bax inhibitor-1/YccA family protein [Clavibacter sp. A6099]
MANPTFSNNPVFNGRGATPTRDVTPESLDELYARPSATASETDRMTFEDTTVKTVSLLAIVVVLGAVAWLSGPLALPLAMLGAIGGLVLGLVNSFKKEPSVPLIVAYAAFEGLFVGGISRMFESIAPGVATQALLGTAAVFTTVLLLFRSGKVRASAKATKIFLFAMVGYALFSLVNVGLMIFGVTTDPWGLRGTSIPGTNIPFGVVLGLFAVVLASYSLVMDFDFIQRGVRAGAPRKYGWTAAFGLVVTIVWLYVELLRLFAILRGNN